MKLVKLVPQQRFVKGCLVAVVVLLFLVSASRLRRVPIELPSTTFDTDRLSADLQAPGEASSPPSEPSEASPESPFTRPPVVRPPLPPDECASDMAFLRRPELELSDTIRYSRRCVRPVWGSGDRDAVAIESGPLVTHATTINLTSCAPTEPADITCEPLQLQVPYPYPAKQYSHLVFGVASTYERLNESLPAFGHWLSGTGALLVGVVVDADDTDEYGRIINDLTALEKAYESWDVTVRMVAPRLKERIGAVPEGENAGGGGGDGGDGDGKPPAPPVEQHHFMLIRDLLEHATPATRWLGILDDDTFFPSLYPVNEALSASDADAEAWLGALSDNLESITKWGYMAFGGAGVFLSVPLARRLDPLLETCVVEASVDTGDGILRDCIYGHSHAQLTVVRGLNQHDVRGDVSGIFESGIRPVLSVHHWKSWYSEPMPAMAAVSGLCGDCFLQRWRFTDDTLLANGYSITHYPAGLLDELELDRLEATWLGASDHVYDFSYGPRRPRLDADQKKSYKLREAAITEGDDFRQLYVYTGNVELGEVDEVIELLWKL